MKGDFIHLGAGALSQSVPHDEFLELCALSTSGELTEEEQKKLDAHLAVCPACRQALEEYASALDQAIPLFAAAEDHADLDPGPRWSPQKTEKEFFERLGREVKQESNPESESPGTRNWGETFTFGSHSVPRAESAWNHVWMLYAAGILLFAALSLFAYRVGVHRGSGMTKGAPPSVVQTNPQEQTPLEAQLSDASHESTVARAQVMQRDRTIADLKRQLARQSDEINQLKTAQVELQAQLQNDNQNKTELTKRQTELTQKLETAENDSHALQAKLGSLAEQSARDAARAKASDVKVVELTKLLQDREAAIEQQEQLLAHDRDIRELMGARDLYIAEVYDVGDRGETKKPYGRVFYTRAKSLIFYAYDLDQQSQLKRASTFQAWGRRGPDRKQALNLGIFYEDNASGKRWVMKCEDLRSLAQIDAVFVTLEPNGPSHKPSDNTLLFAYLKVNPNHP
jgi:Putative zinc-finger